jgi:hydrogenase expression/formation protein HypE
MSPVMGAKPLWLSAAFILEEGFPLSDLARIVDSMARAARAAGVPVVTGDTKVVERGKGDGVFITTAGVGLLPAGRELSGRRAQPGDAILVSGTLGDHGMAIMAGRDSLGFDVPRPVGYGGAPWPGRNIAGVRRRRPCAA